MTSTAVTPRSQSRTQQERRAQTRAKLLDATVQSVLEVGYANTTTRRVAELAGVSQGAQTHHFPHRVDLVTAAVERLAERRIAELQAMESDLPPDPQARLTALLDVIWSDFSSSTFTVFVKLWIAAADDAELYERLIAVEERIARAISELAATLSVERRGSNAWASRLTLVLATLRGLALTEQFEPRALDARRDPWPPLRSLLVESLRSA